jgi:hypothetical protein
MEEYVRRVLVRQADHFENHMVLDDIRGETLPLMAEAIPGQYNRRNGIDIYPIDANRELWVLEVSQADFKGGGKGVKYAGGEVQMSSEWRRHATYRFLDRNLNACAMVRDLLELPAGDDDRLVKIRFLHKFRRHRKAVILLEGGDFNPVGTDVDFGTEVYTHRSRRRFPKR